MLGAEGARTEELRTGVLVVAVAVDAQGAGALSGGKENMVESDDGGGREGGGLIGTCGGGG